MVSLRDIFYLLWLSKKRKAKNMNIATIKDSILISDFLAREGFKPVRQTGGQLAYKAPYRIDGDPSLVVNDKKGMWYDHGEGIGGKIIDLAMKIYNTNDVEFTVNRINQLYDNVPLEKIPSRNDLEQREQRKLHDIVRVKPLGNNFAISAYLESRGVLEEAIKSQRVVEVYYDHINDQGNRKRYFGAGWKNDSGGYDVRSKYAKICINQKDMLYMEGKSGRTNVFEGMTNFLSALKEKAVTMSDTNVVLNTLSLSKKAIEKIKVDQPKEINLFLDNGQGGDKFTQLFKESFPTLIDRRNLYNGFGDYNEKVMDDMQKKSLSYGR